MGALRAGRPTKFGSGAQLSTNEKTRPTLARHRPGENGFTMGSVRIKQPLVKHDPCCVLCGGPPIYVGLYTANPDQPGPRAIIYWLCDQHGLTGETIQRAENVIFRQIAEDN